MTATERDEMGGFPPLSDDEIEEGNAVIRYVQLPPEGHRLAIMRCQLWGKPVAAIVAAQEHMDGGVVAAPIAILAQTPGMFEALTPMPGMCEGEGRFPVQDNPYSMTADIVVPEVGQ